MVTKKRTLVQEVVRRMRNCDRGTEIMRDSGYEEKMRREVVDAGVKVYREQVRKDEAGETVIQEEDTGQGAEGRGKEEEKEFLEEEEGKGWRRRKGGRG